MDTTPKKETVERKFNRSFYKKYSKMDIEEFNTDMIFHDYKRGIEKANRKKNKW